MHISDTELLLKRINEARTRAQKRPVFIGFLNEHEVAIAEDNLSKVQNDYLFWGGYSKAQRQVLGLFPDYIDPQAQEFPIHSLTFKYREQDTLSHRDFLGAFMALGIQRSTIGDILPERGRGVVFLREEIKPYIQENVLKIGNVGVRVIDEITMPLPLIHMYRSLSGVIASKRIDCITAFLCHVSREKSTVLIKNGLVMRNHKEILSPSEPIKEGDILSIKQKGKFIIDQLGPLTGKGRLAVKCRKYI